MRRYLHHATDQYDNVILGEYKKRVFLLLNINFLDKQNHFQFLVILNIKKYDIKIIYKLLALHTFHILITMTLTICVFMNIIRVIKGQKGSL